MGKLVDREGTFRGVIAAHGMSVSTNKFPQFVVKLVATEIWDEDEKIWADWSEYDVNEITAYLVLFGKDGETLNCQQVSKVTGWDGTSFDPLNDDSYVDYKAQWRVAWNTYNDKTKLQVEWFDAYDATPGNTVRKLDDAELKKINAAYSKFLGKKKAPAKATPKSPGKVTAKGVKPTSPKGPVTKKEKKAAPTIPSAKQTATEAQAAEAEVETCTQQEAWDEIYRARLTKYNDDDMAKAWLAAIGAIAPGKLQDQLTGEEWAAVRTRVVDDIGDVDLPF